VEPSQSRTENMFVFWRFTCHVPPFLFLWMVYFCISTSRVFHVVLSDATQ
jgi:hypothetical protein